MKFELKDRELKIFRKVLMEHSFNKDGYEYHFLSIEPDEKNLAYNIIVNVVLPIKGQSYATPVFSGHIHDILSNIWKYVGSSFSYSEKILVDGKEPVNKGIFISSEKQREVLSTMRKEIKEVTLKTAIGSLTFDVYWKPKEKFYSLSDVYVYFNFDIEIKNFMLDSHHVVPNLDIADDVAGAILNVMYDSDYLRDKINSVVYDVMSNEIDITSLDDLYVDNLYYEVRFYISKIDGVEINQKWGNHYDLEPEMFI
jgi:hypothetical protein